jgi:hypothetical protein
VKKVGLAIAQTTRPIKTKEEGRSSSS